MARLAERLDGKVALITGGASGLGAALCEALEEAGATVIAADVRQASAPPADTKGAKATSQLCFDVGDAPAAQHAIHQVTVEHGRLDILINNAGTDVTLPIDELSVADWDRVIATNLHGPFLLAKAAVPLMKAQGGGHIVNIASTAAKRAWPNASAYHASKWGLLGLSHALHAELRPFNIKVTAVVVGGMRTPFLLDRFPDIDAATLQDPKNVADTVRFVLTQPASSVVPEIAVLPMRETSWP
jgi:NAD(P)-dependent dehydrogenase (short-subunit alcohol dehydrogenase family)